MAEFDDEDLIFWIDQADEVVKAKNKAGRK